MIIFTKFHKDWSKIVDFLLLAKFWACPLFFDPPSKYNLTMTLRMTSSQRPFNLHVAALSFGVHWRLTM